MPPPRPRRRAALLVSAPVAADDPPAQPRRAGPAKAAGAPEATKGGRLDPAPDPNSPHELFGFEPRDAGDDDLWTFGRAHAAVHHVLGAAPGGDAFAAATALDDFAMTHGLDFGLLGPSAQLLDDVTRRVVQQVSVASQNGTGFLRKDGSPQGPRGVNILVLDSGLGGRTLRTLPGLLGAPLLTMGDDDDDDDDWGVHEVVSIESDPQLSGFGARLVSHALGLSTDMLSEDSPRPGVRHLPLLPGDETTLDESLETLREGYGLPTFDLVLLGGDDGGWDRQQEQIQSLLRAGALAPGAVVHAEGAAAPEGDKGVSTYVDSLSGEKNQLESQFGSQVHDLGNGKAAVVSTLKRLGPKADEL